MPINIAIVGSGPAGFYTADALLKSAADVRIDIIERLPSPFGLVRAGVAPDHLTTKNISRKFEKTALDDNVRYFGNVDVGRDLGLDDLRRLYDAVVLAVGGPVDRPSNIPGADKQGVYGAAALVGWYNGHPDFRGLDPDLNAGAVAVIGNGNVAIDIARVLSRSAGELAASDIADHAAAAIRASSSTEVYVFGRRGPLEAKFTNVELREMGHLEIASAHVDGAQLPDGVGELEGKERRLKEKNLATLRDFAARQSHDKAKRMHFRFFAAPAEILGTDRVAGLRLERTRLDGGRAVGTGEFFDVECGLVATAIGYRAAPLAGAPFDDARGIIPNDGGRVEDGLYVVGWAMRGPIGVISTNRADGGAVAGHIVADLAGAGKAGRDGLIALLGERGVRAIDYAEWLKIDAAEIANATPPAPRRKFVTADDMLAVLDAPGSERSIA